MDVSRVLEGPLVHQQERRLELRGPPLGDGHARQCSLPRCSSWKTVSPPVGRVQDEQAKTLHSSYVSICFLEIQLVRKVIKVVNCVIILISQWPIELFWIAKSKTNLLFSNIFHDIFNRLWLSLKIFWGLETV